MTVAAAHTRALVQIHRQLGLAKKPKARLPRQVYPMRLEAEYAKSLLAIVAHTQASLVDLATELPSLLASARASRGDARADSNEGRRAQQLVDRARDKMAAAVQPHQVENLARQFASRTATYQRMQLGRQVHAALGVDVPFTDPKLAPMSEHFVSENVSLIKTIPTRIHDDVERMVTRAVANGTLHDDLADQIRDRFKVAKSDARRIARDQIGKFYGNVNHARQRELGVTRFIWRTVGDSRVRDEHDDLMAESEIEPFSFDDPPDTEDGPALPGEPIQCRCYAEPVFSDIGLDDDEEEAPPDESDDDEEETDDETDDEDEVDAEGDDEEDDDDRDDSIDEFLLWCDRCDAFDPDQPRDERGRWGSGGTAADIGEHGKNARESAKQTVEHLKAIRDLAAARSEHAHLVDKIDRLAANARSAARKAEAATTEAEAAKHAETARKKMGEANAMVVAAIHQSLGTAPPPPAPAHVAAPKPAPTPAPTPAPSVVAVASGPAQPLPPPIAEGPRIAPHMLIHAYEGVFSKTGQFVGMSAGQQVSLRDHLSKSLEPYGFERNDPPDGAALRVDIKRNYRARGTHSTGGQITVSQDVAHGAAELAGHLKAGTDLKTLPSYVQAGMVNDYRTHIHEQIHGYGPRNQWSGAYHKEGVYTEEVTTEVAARKVVRDQLGLKHGDIQQLSAPIDAYSAGSYNREIHSATQHVQKSMLENGIHVGYQEAYDHVEAAAMRFKSMKQSSEDHRSPAGLTRAFAKSFDFTAAAAAKGKSLTEAEHDKIRLAVLNRMTMSGGGNHVWTDVNGGAPGGGSGLSYVRP